MGALQRFEQRLEHIVTGTFARVFRSAVQPMEIAAALQREVDNSAQILSRDRRLAPNNFTIDLAASDYDRLSTYGEALARELATLLHEHAASQGYLFTGPVALHFTRDEDLGTGRFRVRSQASAAVRPVPGQSLSETAVSRAALYLEVNGVRHPLQPPGLTVGRGTNADLRVDDPGVSRRHVEFRVADDPRQASVTVVDLGSTNGTTVDGQRVQHARLQDGSVVQIGSTRIVVRVAGRQAGGAQSRPAASYDRGPASPSPDGPRPGSAYGDPAAKPAGWGRSKSPPPPFRPVDPPSPGTDRPASRPWNG